MADLLLENIYKVYDGGVRAVSDFNLKIADKEFVVFVGPSGCGKSTTLRMIAGLEEITSGSLFIGGAKMNDVEPKDRNIAMVFQNYALYPHMTVFENMAFGLKLRKVNAAEIEKRVKNAAEILGITELLARKPKALSGGQRQRVALGRAIVREPNVFLLDEPLSNLDAKLRVQMRAEITKLHKRLATTFIYVTHDQTEAMTMGDRIVVMKDGFIQQVDSPATLYEQPRNVFVATFLGSPQMNIFEADLVKGESLAISFGEGHNAFFSETKAKQLSDDQYIGKKVLFGIRPENIKLGKDGVKAKVDVVEHLGSETIIYAEVSGLSAPIIVKVPTNYDIVEGLDIKLVFDMEKSHLFDIDTNQSIMGVPDVNRVPCSIDGEDIVLNGLHFPIPQKLKERFFDFTVRDISEIRIPATEVRLDPAPDCIEFTATVDFTVQGNDCIAYYVKSDVKDGYFVFRVKKSYFENGAEISTLAEVDGDSVTKSLSSKILPPEAGDKVKLYIPFSEITLNSATGLRLNSREKISDNTADCVVKSKKGKTFIKVGKNTLEFDDMGIADGEYTMKLISDKIGFVYDKKYAKQNKVPYLPVDNSVTAKAYDEDKIGDKNAVFCEVSGFKNYVTAVLPADFSVYKMPVFKLVFPADSFTLIKK